MQGIHTRQTTQTIDTIQTIQTIQTMQTMIRMFWILQRVRGMLLIPRLKTNLDALCFWLQVW